MQHLPRPDEDTNPTRILVVDDEVFVREALELYLVSEGFRVFPAEDGKAALEILEAEPFDLAILDILMPRMNGIALLREMRKRYPDIEVIMASGCSTIESAIECIQLGAYDYVAKPILNFDEGLLKIIHRALERRRLLTANRKLALDLVESHRELQSKHQQLARLLKELKVLENTSRELSSGEGLHSALKTAASTLSHLGIPQAGLLLWGDPQWRAHASPHFSPIPGSAAEFPANSELLSTGFLCGDAVEISLQDHLDLLPLLRASGGSMEETSKATLLPLRTKGQLHGVLIPFHPTAKAPGEALSCVLKLVAALLANPVAYARMSQDQVNVD